MVDHVFNYVECDVPEGLTLREWRYTERGRRHPRQRMSWWRRMRTR